MRTTIALVMLFLLGCRGDEREDSVLKQMIVRPKEKAREAVSKVEEHHAKELKAFDSGNAEEEEDDNEKDGGEED